jgi:hypothetical protein
MILNGGLGAGKVRPLCLLSRGSGVRVPPGAPFCKDFVSDHLFSYGFIYLLFTLRRGMETRVQFAITP